MKTVPYDADDLYALQGCSFITVIGQTYQNLFAVLLFFPARKKIFRREIFDGTYDVGPAVFTQVKGSAFYCTLIYMTLVVTNF